MNSKITGTGSYIPGSIEANRAFEGHTFYNIDGSEFEQDIETIIEKFKAITGIAERRYVGKELTTSDIAFFAAEKALESSKIDKETLDYIIVAQNFGDVKAGTIQSDMVPSIAARVKHKLKIENPKCVAYDVIFGCPGWVEGSIQAHAFLKSGMAKKCLVIGAETLSRVVDKHDRDSMIYSDGAGAAIWEAVEDEGGILSCESATFALQEANFIFFGKSYKKGSADDVRYIKMHGRKIYNFALTHVPSAMKSALDKANVKIGEVKKIFIHQANQKMDEAIVERFYNLYDQKPPNEIMPMSIAKLGNSSVATVPTLYDLFLQGEFKHKPLKKGDIIIFASVGAGMNINTIVYRY
ncbi:MAG TPA: ketoacyl-ACP synthase III [Flavobacteriaceae bacterium]|nr:ketoacyl-ACP synthase III [Flavobacteriaceae bacterium]